MRRGRRRREKARKTSHSLIIRSLSNHGRPDVIHLDIYTRRRPIHQLYSSITLPLRASVSVSSSASIRLSVFVSVCHRCFSSPSRQTSLHHPPLSIHRHCFLKLRLCFCMQACGGCLINARSTVAIVSMTFPRVEGKHSFFCSLSLFRFVPLFLFQTAPFLRPLHPFFSAVKKSSAANNAVAGRWSRGTD